MQPDVVLALGISGARTLADLALRRNRWFTPHTWTNGIGLLANLHVCCGVGGGPVSGVPLRPARVDAGAARLHARRAAAGRRADGCLAVPAAPGLGIELDEDAVAHYAVADERG